MLEDAPPGVTPDQWMRAVAATLILEPETTSNVASVRFNLQYKADMVYQYIKDGKVPPSR